VSGQKMLFNNTPGIVECKRCGEQCRISGSPGKDAKMLRFAEGPGLCVNCAVHDWLRNTYPVNILLTQSGPKALPHLQEQFAGIMRLGKADAMPDEIDWEKIVENWDLPFPHKIKPSSTNPCSQLELEEIAAGKRPGLVGRFDTITPKCQTLLDNNRTITSFEQLNELEPGLGDDLKKCLRSE